MPALRKGPFLLALFVPDNVLTNVSSNELLIGGEGFTVRVPLDVFIAKVDWPTLSTHYGIWRAEQDRLRMEKVPCTCGGKDDGLHGKMCRKRALIDEGSNGESLELPVSSEVHND